MRHRLLCAHAGVSTTSSLPHRQGSRLQRLPQTKAVPPHSAVGASRSRTAAPSRPLLSLRAGGTRAGDGSDTSHPRGTLRTPRGIISVLLDALGIAAGVTPPAWVPKRITKQSPTVSDFNMPASDGESRKNTYFHITSTSIFISLTHHHAAPYRIITVSGSWASRQGWVHRGQAACTVVPSFMLPELGGPAWKMCHTAQGVAPDQKGTSFFLSLCSGKGD